MRSKNFITALLISFCVGASIICSCKDASEENEPSGNGGSSISYSGNAQGYEWIDLCLPSGTRWATCNVGASTPEEYGEFFAWGETSPKDNYNWSTYKYCNGSYKTLTKYCFETSYGDNGFVDNITNLLSSDDAATTNWGEKWQMPTREEIEELINYTKYEWVTQNGINGILIKSLNKKNNKSIFLPAGGSRDDMKLSDVGYNGDCWSRSLDHASSYVACSMYYNSNGIFSYYYGYYRGSGRTVRPVLIEKAVRVKEIKLSNTLLTLFPRKTKRLLATIYPSNAQIKDIAWESSNKDVAVVDDDGNVTARNIGSCTITCRALDGSGVTADCQVVVEHEYVDLGLPSGILWAAYNIGASHYNSEEYGDYFAWGETAVKDTTKAPLSYGWNNYKYCKGSSTTITKYCNDSIYGYNKFTDEYTQLLQEDDAATKCWGTKWQTPNINQIKELYNSSNTTTEWKILNGKTGVLITSKRNNKSIFLPAAGYYNNEDLNFAGSYGLYLTKTLGSDNPSYARNLYFSSGEIGWDKSFRCYGLSVRPVRKK